MSNTLKKGEIGTAMSWVSSFSDQHSLSKGGLSNPRIVSTKTATVAKYYLSEKNHCDGNQLSHCT